MSSGDFLCKVKARVERADNLRPKEIQRRSGWVLAKWKCVQRDTTVIGWKMRQHRGEKNFRPSDEVDGSAGPGKGS